MFKYSSLLCPIYSGALLILLLGLVVIVGWFIGSVSLIQIDPQFVPMQFNTALGFVLISLAIMGLASNHQNLNRYIGIILILLGGLTLIQHMFGTNFFIDELFMKHYIMTGTSQAGRMAPNTALNFLLSGIAIFVISKSKIGLNHFLISSLLGSLITGLGTVAFLGYLSNIKTAYGWGKLTKMAIHTSIGFIVVGILLILVTRYLSGRTKLKTPSLTLPLTLFLLGITITICFWQALYASGIYVDSQDGIQIINFVTSGILIFGGLFSMAVAIAMWFAIRSREQLQVLRLAQQEILVLNQQLEKLSYLDGLTEIPNRRSFDLALDKELGRAYRYQYPVALILIDIDYFKAYNDFYGHQLGDICIQQVALTLNSLTKRKTDMAARYGGEEFVLLLPDISLQNVEKLAAIALQAIVDLGIPHEASKVNPFVTISAGVNVCIPHLDTSPREIIQRTDQALYDAKAKGRNCFITNTHTE